MTMEEIRALMDSTEIYYDPVHPDYIEAQKLQELPLPFMEWALEEVTFGADDEVYHAWDQLIVRVFWDIETHSAPEIVKAALRRAHLTYSTEKEFLQELGFWQTTFTTEV